MEGAKQMTSTAPIKDSLDTSKLRILDVDGIPTRVYVDGTGEPLVLVHGGQFSSLYTIDAWSLNLPGLAEHFQVVAIDKLGQGHTGNPKSDDDYTAEALERHTFATLQALGISSAHLVGHSRGAWLVAYMAFKRPGLAKTLVCVDTNTLAPDDPKYPGGKFYDELAARTPAGPPSRESVRMEPDAQTWHKDRVTDDFVARLLAVAQLPTQEEGRRRYEQTGNAVWMPSLNRARKEVIELIDAHGMPAPTLVIWGYDDPSAPLPLAFNLFDHITKKTEKAELHVFNHAGHYTFRDHPERFNRLVRDFCLG
jgi:2-hydroxy-6-oxo-6-(2'-carboxyphenyl)-hexa-2,4-dienoate hydrolase